MSTYILYIINALLIKSVCDNFPVPKSMYKMIYSDFLPAGVDEHSIAFHVGE